MAEVWGGPCEVKGPQEGAVEVAPRLGTWTTREGFMHAVSLGWAGWNDRQGVSQEREGLQEHSSG